MFKTIPVRIILPVVLTVLLFVMTIFLLILPLVEAKLTEGKREVIRELTEVAWSSLNVYAEKEKNGQLTLGEAQASAIEHLRSLRYGPELKDYFWINDMHPRIIMHPYRPDLEGKNISNFADPSGKRLFVEFVKTVSAYGAGYVNYQWQWKDDPSRIVPKISFVKGFEPWGWIVGTGIYVEDVRNEIATITRHLTLMCLGILVIIMALSSYIIWRSVMVKTEKKRAEEQARLRQEQLFHAAKMVSLGTLVSGVAHEINNPITSVMLNTPTLQKVWDSVLPILDEHCRTKGEFRVGNMDYTRIRERIPFLLSSIEDGVRRVKEIVTDLKDFARDKPAEMSDVIHVNDVTQKAIGLVSNLIKKSTDNFSTHYTADLPAFRGNAQRIEQVVINLLVNACQSLRDSQGAISVSTGYDAESECVFIHIRDEGTGIPQDVIQRITDPFFTTKRDSGGTGLGLAISERIMQDHCGTLEFISASGKGTTVRACFPELRIEN
ncbi:cache domain-containing protein [Desulfonema magnum]|uniref:cache domain-containing protein n=1 Tax=Desulfonema magnum TaxID=45655 RepID=UPI001A9BD967|nr:cache domain-containing protein [Desulfonema magnum]